MTKKNAILDHVRKANGLTNPAIASMATGASFRYARATLNKYARNCGGLWFVKADYLK